MATVGSAIVCDRLRLYGNRSLCDRLWSTIRDRLRSFAIIWKPAFLRSSAIICDRLRSCDHMETKVLRSVIEMYPIIFLILTDESTFLSHKARMFDYRNAHLLALNIVARYECVWNRNSKNFKDKHKKSAKNFKVGKKSAKNLIYLVPSWIFFETLGFEADLSALRTKRRKKFSCSKISSSISAMLFSLIFHNTTQHPSTTREYIWHFRWTICMATVGSAIVCDRLRWYGNRSLCDRLWSIATCEWHVLFTKNLLTCYNCFPPGASVNDGISKDSFLDKPFHLSFSPLADFVDLIIAKGPGCFLFKKDLKRAHRQIPVDTRDYNLLGYHWNDFLYFDLVLPFGLRSATLACQPTLNAIALIFYSVYHHQCKLHRWLWWRRVLARRRFWSVPGLRNPFQPLGSGILPGTRLPSFH